MLRSSGSNNVANPWKRIVEYRAIQKENCAESLILSRGSYMAVDRKAGQKCVHVISAHRRRMTLVVEENETLDPREVGFFPSTASNCCAHAIKKFRLFRHARNVPRVIAEGKSFYGR
jgi:hypothetical protein